MMRLGKGFADMIDRESKRSKHTSKNVDMAFETSGFIYTEKPISSWETFPFYLILIVIMFVLFFRLFHMQIVKGSENRKRADENRITVVSVPAPRGVIYDRNGEVLARNAPDFKLFDKDGIPVSITRDEALQREAKGDINVLIMQKREYPNNEVLSHIIGYTGEVTKAEIKDKPFYLLGSQIGRMGIEEQYESILKGIDGKELVETDALGKKIRVLSRVNPIPGKDVYLTVSLPLSIQIEKAISEVYDNKLYEGGKPVMGAVVVSNPKTGEILSMISFPSFNPNSFTSKDETAILQLLNDSKTTPLLNRAIGGEYPPGSTFKLIVAAAALEERKINRDTQIEDEGSFSVGGAVFPNWYFLQYGKKEGMLNVVSAIKRSNDIFFYRTAGMVGLESLGKWMNMFGLGKPMGIDLPGEQGGNIPTDKWKNENIGEGWYLGDTYHLGIGQGYLLTTPLQVNGWTNILASDGVFCKPKMVQIQNSPLRQGFAGQAKLKTENEKCENIGLKKETIDLIHEGMKEACSEGGTGWPLFNFSVKDSISVKGRIDGKNFIDKQNGITAIPISCKTGTSEFGDPQKRTHAWFTSFAPLDNPEITVTVLVEKGGEGSNVAAPIAKKVFEFYFR